MTEATTVRPRDIVSPMTDAYLDPHTTLQDARAAGRRGYDRPTADNTICLLVDHQAGLVSGVRDFGALSEYRANVVGLARMAKALNLPTLITTSNAQWQNGDTLQEIRDLFPDEPIYRRTGIINCYADPSFRAAFERVVEGTGRRHVIIAGVTIGTCCTFPTLSLIQDGYSVFPVVDACGAWNRYEAEAAMSRMASAGAELTTVFSLACELQSDWKLPTATAMLDPFKYGLPEYGLAVDNFWNNANGHTVPDPFGMVK